MWIDHAHYTVFKGSLSSGRPPAVVNGVLLMIPLHSRVRLISDRYQKDGAYPGMIGYIIERYADGAVEIEVSDPRAGTTIVQFVARESDIEPAETFSDTTDS